MICSDIWHKYHESYFKTVIHNFTNRLGIEIWDKFEISRVGINAKYQVQIMLLYICFYYNLRNSVILHRLFIFFDFFRFVGEQIGFKVLVFGPAGPDI